MNHHAVCVRFRTFQPLTISPILQKLGKNNTPVEAKSTAYSLHALLTH